MSWKFETRDANEYWQYWYDNTSVDDSNPVIIKTLGAPKYENEGKTWITQNTPITIEAYDAGECGISGIDYCEYRYEADGVGVLPWTAIQWDTVTQDTPPHYKFTFNYKEDSEHFLEVRCFDNAGNSAYHSQTEFVETVKPVTTKTYSPNAYINGTSEWISAETLVNLTAVDPDPHPSGVSITKYIVIPLTDDSSCEQPELYCNDDPDPDTNPTILSIGYTPYTEPFTIPESCHIIQFKSTDNVGNRELMKFQCVFVDGTPPVLTKTVGDPKIPVQDGFDYWVSQRTPISLSCEDTGPHPSNNVTIHWSYTVNGGEPIIGSANAPAYDLFFNEDSEHVLDAWCTDAVGNTSLHDIETFWVDGTPPEMSKTMLGTENTDYLGDCPPEEDGDECYVADNGKGGVHVSVADPDPTGMGHNVNNSACTYNLWWDATTEECDLANGQDYDSELKCLLESGEFSEDGTDILFHQDSTHTLVINCQDALGNATETDTEVFLVDSKPPVTTKTYGTPFYTDGQSDWITTATQVTLAATDAKVGVDKTLYRTCLHTAFPNGTAIGTVDGCTCERLADFNEYSAPFTIAEESQHCIEFYSTDLLGNAETWKSQLVFVENQAPVVTKTVGEPNVECSETDSTGCDYYITTKTPITLDCRDQEPHPVNAVTNNYRYRVSQDCENWGLWTEWKKVDGEIYFAEDSCHELEYNCSDALGNTSGTLSEIDIVDSQAPVITTEIVGPHAGNCQPEETDSALLNFVQEPCYIDGVTQIAVTAVDPAPHPVNDVTCNWSYTLDQETQVNYGPYTTFPINFPEETQHNLTIECRDALGNITTDNETFYVDKTPPETRKWYGNPAYPTEGYPKWITSQTPVYLKADDAGPHKSGISEINWRVSLVEDRYCENQDVCQEATDATDKEYDSSTPKLYGDYDASFTIQEQSCHLIEYYSVDNVEKTETVKKQCVYVDNTPPEPLKTVGDPKTKWDGADSIFYPEIKDACWKSENPLECWKITLLTPITLECTDQQPHPVDNETVCFSVGLDGDNVTEEYCREYNGQLNEADGYCCMPKTTEFYFGEETEHNLAYYCVDALGNKGSTDDEKFKVEGTKFTIELNKKWNLVSVPFVLIDKNPEAVFADVNENVEAVWTYDAFADEWFVYHPNSPSTSNLSEINPGWGYWLSAYNPDTLTIGGSLFSPITTPPTRELKKGWNLIGYYGTDGILSYNGPVGNGKQAKCALYSLGASMQDKGWTALTTYWEPFNPNQWKSFDYYDRMDPGAGYWISVPEEGQYEYTTNCGGLI